MTDLDPRREDPKREDPQREFLRHAIATLAYRGARALENTPAGFADFRAGGGVRTPGQILAHLSDLLDWARAMAEGNPQWRESQPLSWDQEVARFFTALKAFDEFLASGTTLLVPMESLFQGPIADALTHVGQLAMLRRLAGSPAKGENYFVAEISAGCVGPDQPAPKRRFE
jgi:hypothetical protein